jgi:hypothetical protein
MNGAEWLQVQIETGRLTPTPSMATLAKAAQILGATPQLDHKKTTTSEDEQDPLVAVMSRGHVHDQRSS